MSGIRCEARLIFVFIGLLIMLESCTSGTADQSSTPTAAAPTSKTATPSTTCQPNQITPTPGIAITGGTTQQSPLLTYNEHKAGVVGLSWSHDGKYIASASDDTTVHIWNAANGKTTTTYTGHTSYVFAVAWSPDGKEIASGNQNGSTQIWNTATGKIQTTYCYNLGPVWLVAWSPDGKEIASAAGVNTPARIGLETIQVWDATTGKSVLSYNGHGSSTVQWGDGIFSIAWSPDGKHIASGGADNTVQEWDASNGQRLATFTGHTSVVWTVAWSPDGKQIASASQDETVKIWQAL